MRTLLERIASNQAIVGVIGLGYVGLPISMLYSKKFRVVGYETDTEKIKRLAQGLSNVDTVPSASLMSVLGKSFSPTSEESELDQCDVFVICVPTPLGANKEPDLTAVCNAARLVAGHLRKGTLIILESTTYPGTTDTVLVPILEQVGMKAGLDFFVAYSPERIDPGQTDVKLEKIPKIVGGYDPESTMVACRFLQTCFERVVVVKDCRTAEAAKMLENIFRAVNIALVNELTLALERLDVDVWEVIAAASTKPFGFMTFRPGPGVGGHCIPLDPYYFAYAAKRVGVSTRFIELSGEVNSFMPFHIVELLSNALVASGRSIKGSRVAVLGLSYKRNISDTRESPSAKVIDEIVRQHGTVAVYDPFATGIQTESGFLVSSDSVESALERADATVLLVDHSAFEAIPASVFQNVMNPNPVVVDCRNIIAAPPPGTLYVGLGRRGGTQTSGAIAPV